MMTRLSLGHTTWPLLVALSLTSCASYDNQASGSPGGLETVRAKLERGLSQDVIVDWVDDDTVSFVPAGAWTRSSSRHVGQSVLTLTSPDALDRLVADPAIAHVYPDLALRYDAVSRVADFIAQPPAIERANAAKPIGVVVVDTGLDYTHPDFGSCDAPGAPGCRVVHVEDIAPDDGELDDDGHGSNVSGIIAGLAPNARIIGLDAFDGPSAKSSIVIKAIDWTIEHKEEYDIAVLNLSLGGGRHAEHCGEGVSPFAKPIARARAAGILVVASAGNEGHLDGIHQPACAPQAISVGAVYDRDTVTRNYGMCEDVAPTRDSVTCFSNTAEHLDLLAPGQGITASGRTMSGTSQAAPVAAASLALLRSLYPDEAPETTASRLLDRGPNVVDDRTGTQTPRVDFTHALDPEIKSSKLQVESCQPVVSPPEVEFSGSGGDVTLEVTVGSTCSWNADHRNGDWLDLVVESTGSGDGAIHIRVGPSFHGERGTVLDVGGTPVLVRQHAYSDPG